MPDILKYRFPGDEVVSQEGRFYPLNDPAGYQGFVVTDFTQKLRLGFSTEITNASDKYLLSEKMEIDDRASYIDRGEDLKDILKSEGLKKVVLSRIKHVKASVEREELFHELCQAYPNALIYIIKSALFGCWIGATPEVLLKKDGSSCVTTALAGTKKEDDLSEWGAKEIEEQALVSVFVESTLDRNAISWSKKGPDELQAGPVKHLYTKYTLEGKIDKVKLVNDLHPTPAVCGLPRDRALQVIEKIEQHDRGLYTGVIGLMGENTKLYVNLRCMQIDGDSCYLYLGGGYTIDSNVEQEWEETENKAATLLNVMKKK